MKKLAQYLMRTAKERRKFLVTAHPHADPDAVGCLVALGDVLKKLGAPVRIGVPGGLNRLSKSVLNTIRRKVDIDPSPDVDIVVLVDTSSLDQLGKIGEQIREKGPELIVIDHHRPSKGMLRLAKFYHVDENTSSAAELVLKLIQEMGMRPSPVTATLLLVGITSDTGQFRFAHGETFKAVNTLLESGASYRRALRALATPDDPSKRVAVLKAAQRAELHKIHGRWIALSELSSFEANAAAMLIKIGADVALVGSEEKGQVRL
ncbi:MAG: DHH family phosphoesterase, partial [Candidatus Hadarchaeota archaeon]|nr:DHH family phosphoesterase [Candidatus Hadarchaeota archaeon]